MENTPFRIYPPMPFTMSEAWCLHCKQMRLRSEFDCNTDAGSWAPPRICLDCLAASRKCSTCKKRVKIGGFEIGADGKPRLTCSTCRNRKKTNVYAPAHTKRTEYAEALPGFLASPPRLSFSAVPESVRSSYLVECFIPQLTDDEVDEILAGMI